MSPQSVTPDGIEDGYSIDFAAKAYAVQTARPWLAGHIYRVAALTRTGSNRAGRALQQISIAACDVPECVR